MRPISVTKFLAAQDLPVFPFLPSMKVFDFDVRGVGRTHFLKLLKAALEVHHQDVWVITWYVFVPSAIETMFRNSVVICGEQSWFRKTTTFTSSLLRMAQIGNGARTNSGRSLNSSFHASKEVLRCFCYAGGWGMEHNPNYCCSYDNYLVFVYVC